MDHFAAGNLFSSLYVMGDATSSSVHVNEITAVVPAVLAKAIFRAPLVVHVRSVQQTEGIPWRRRFLTYLLQRYADAVIAIDATVRLRSSNVSTQVRCAWGWLGIFYRSKACMIFSRRPDFASEAK
jgi:hypothetical protein